MFQHVGSGNARQQEVQYKAEESSLWPLKPLAADACIECLSLVAALTNPNSEGLTPSLDWFRNKDLWLVPPCSLAPHHLNIQKLCKFGDIYFSREFCQKCKEIIMVCSFPCRLCCNFLVGSLNLKLSLIFHEDHHFFEAAYPWETLRPD